MQTPDAVQAMIDATNAADSEAFVAAFSADAYLEDWGRAFHGREGIARWNQSDNIGKKAHFEAAGTRREGDAYIVTLVVTGGGYNGTGDIAFEIADGLISRMIISAD